MRIQHENLAHVDQKGVLRWAFGIRLLVEVEELRQGLVVRITSELVASEKSKLPVAALDAMTDAHRVFPRWGKPREHGEPLGWSVRVL